MANSDENLISKEWDVAQVASAQIGAWQEIFKIPAMSMGIYKLGAGEIDRQSPHSEDEAYFILSGKGKLEVEDKVYEATTGKLLFDKKHARHKFIDIEEDMSILVFFAPAEYSQA